MTKAITKKEESGLVVPSDVPSGFEDIDSDVLIIPRLRLLQSMSDSVTDGDGKPGDFENSLTKTTYGTEIEVVPLTAKNGAVYLDTEKGMICKSADGKNSINGDVCSECPYNEYWRTWKDDTPPKCNGTIDLLVVAKDSIGSDIPNVMMLSFLKTSYKLGKQLVSMGRLSGKPLFAQSYTLGSVKESNGKHTYHNYKVKPTGFLAQEEFDSVVGLVKSFGSRKVEVESPEAHQTTPAPEEDI